LLRKNWSNDWDLGIGKWEMGIGNWEMGLLKNQSPKVYNKVLIPGSNAQNEITTL
jgi:hypothetical protein